MNGFDFDKTIYKKDSSIQFYLYLVYRHPYLVCHLIVFSVYYLLYVLKLKNKKETKEKMFSIVKYISDIDYEVNRFWHNKHLERWYLAMQKDNDIVISASPLFLLEDFTKRMGINNIIATNIDKKTGKIIDKNIYGIEKVNAYKKIYKNKKLDKFYTDSSSDLCMKEVCKEVLIVKSGRIQKNKNIQ